MPNYLDFGVLHRMVTTIAAGASGAAPLREVGSPGLETTTTVAKGARILRLVMRPQDRNSGEDTDIADVEATLSVAFDFNDADSSYAPSEEAERYRRALDGAHAADTNHQLTLMRCSCELEDASDGEARVAIATLRVVGQLQSTSAAAVVDFVDGAG